MTSTVPPLTRSFRDLPEKARDDDEEFEFLHAGFGGRDLTGEQLLQADRVLIVSEAGMGKTHECKAQQQRLWGAGKPAFFLELMRLATEPLERQFDAEEAKRFESWKQAETERAYFFLDSVDELKLTAHSFDSTLKIFATALGDNLGRACIVLTTRPGPDDRNIVRQRLPIPGMQRVIVPEELFADAAMRVEQPKADAAAEMARWRFVGLTPLDAAQMRILAIQQQVTSPDELLAAVEAEHAQEFAKRPLDFIDLCADWNVHGRIRGHREQVESSIAHKLRPHKGRRERAPLTAQRAREGAERLALAALMTRRFTLWHGYEADRRLGNNALDPAEILKDWTDDEVQTLLERALFGFASYGRVRFHNRTVIEFLAAERLRGLVGRRLSQRTLRRLLFVTSPGGVALIRPTMQPVAAWLAPWIEPIHAEILKREPSVLLRFADPGALSPEQQAQALERYVEWYGRGGWRGMHVPALQCRRLASSSLASTILRLWASGIENPEVRETLLELIEAGLLAACADIAHEAATSPKREARERLLGLQALAAIGDPRMPALLDQMASQHADWGGRLTTAAIVHLYPANLTVTQLLGALRGVDYDPSEVGGISRHLPGAIVEAKLPPASIEELRQGLTALVGEECRWEPAAFCVRTARGHLVGALIKACELSLRDHAPEAALAESIALALQLSKEDDYSDDESPNLRTMLASAPTSLRARVFWAQHGLLVKLMSGKEVSSRHLRLGVPPSLDLQVENDMSWLQAELGDSARSIEERQSALECVIQLAQQTEDRAATLRAARPLVQDDVTLDARLKELIAAFENPPQNDWAEKHAKRREEQARKDWEDRATWVEFWRELASQPQAPLEAGRVTNIAYNLLKVMSRLPNEDRYAGWNRGFLERVFDQATVERLRQLMVSTWRVVPPPLLAYERPPEERNSVYASWRIGLAGLHAEAEAPLWARRLSDADARLATRYAGTATDGLPSWMAALAQEHPNAVRDVLLPELANQLENTDAQAQHSFLLQSLEYSKPGVIALFIDTIRDWVTRAWVSGQAGSTPSNKFERAIAMLVEHGTDADLKAVSAAAHRLVRANANEEQVAFWLPWLMRLSPADAVDELESLSASVDPASRSAMTRWLGALFGHHASNVVPETLLNNPSLLSRLALLAYRHVRLIDDLPRGSRRSSDARDDAEFARSQLVNALLRTKGIDAWRAKLEFAKDPLVAHFRDRAETIAKQTMAEEWDAPVYDLSDVLRLEQELELAPATRADMARLLVDRLEVLDDYLREDGSPRELWSKIEDERVLRRAIADRLEVVAHGAYSVSQEGVTAEEKETDLRLRSSGYPIEAVIELKVGDKPKYTYDVLSKALRDQLVGKYMAPEARRVGCLLISISSTRRFAHPVHGGLITVEEVVAMLQDEARDLVRGLGFQSLLEVRLLDLRLKKTP